MTNYVLIFSGGGMPETEEEQQAEIAAWGAWYGAMGEAVVDGGNPFAMSKGIKSDGSVTDSAALQGATGYTIVSADSLDAACEMAKGCPVLKRGGEVSVFETFQVM